MSKQKKMRAAAISLGAAVIAAAVFSTSGGFVKELEAAPAAAAAATATAPTATVAPSAAPAVNQAEAFSDTSSHWAKASIELAVGRGYVNGYEDNSFRPNQKVTRAELVKMAVLALQFETGGAALQGSAWYKAYVAAATAEGLVQNKDFLKGDWNTPMTRFEMARLAVRAIGQSGKEDSEWMYLATKAGLITGTDKTGTLDENGTTTRAQAVTIIERILSIKAGKTLPADKHAVNRAELKFYHTNIFSVMPGVFGTGVKKYTIPWDKNNLTLTTKDGLWKGTLKQLIAIDIGDPDDPNRNVVPIDELKVLDPSGLPEQDPLVNNFKDAILLIPIGDIVNKAPSKYHNDLPFLITMDYVDTAGYPMDALRKGILDGPRTLIHKKLNDTAGLIIPKKLKTRDYGAIALSMYVLGESKYYNYSKRIINVQLPPSTIIDATQP